MANNGNLKPVLSKSEARKRGSNGGKKSAEVRRKKRDMRKQLELLLSLDVNNKTSHNRLLKLGVPEKDINNLMLVNVAIFNEALDGNVRAAEFIRDMLGFSPKNHPITEEAKHKVEIIDDLPED